MSDTGRPKSYLPTPGLTYDPADHRYWEPDLLDAEMRRAFDICHGCRMCFKYCDAFPLLFKLADDGHDGDVHRLSAPEVDAVVDQCFQCKLCEVQCPYTPRDNHEFQLDLPRLIHRYQAARLRAKGEPSLRDSVLGDPDVTGALARASLGIANVMNRVGAHRWLMEKALGIHRDKLLPDFAPSTFERWAKQTGRLREEPGAEAVLFQTCFVQHNAPEVGRDTVEVYEKNQVDLACIAGLKCCGMPAWEHGDLGALQERARHNLDLLTPFVEQGAKVVVINPTCAMMMRREYPELVDEADRERARIVAAAVRDVSEFLWSIREEPRFNTDFRSTPDGAIAYHAPCHLRAQAVGFRGRDLMRKIPGAKPQMTLECCGHDGTFAMKVEGFEASARIGQKAFDGLKAADAQVWSTDCPLAAIQFEQHAGKKPLHPMSVLARAYRPDGFPKQVEPRPPSDQA